MATITESEELYETLRELGTAQRAAAERAYLKSTLRHLGVPVPAVRRVVRTWVRHHPVVTSDDIFGLADELWDRPVHETRLAAIELLVAVPGAVTAVRLPWLEARLRECHTWALVDPLAGVVADLACRDSESVLPVLDRWVTDHDFWVRRAAVLALRSLLRHGDQLDRLFAYAEQLLPETEFFIRKVLGWVLREEAPRHPREVSAWLRAHMADMNLVTLREPLRKLPDAAEVRALYDTRRNSPG
ncbi:MAG: DNA alkylation repair protein [Actinobacteria bacterium]|nr:DNA alkylation repair protein [Actinomycetota bacterium]